MSTYINTQLGKSYYSRPSFPWSTGLSWLRQVTSRNDSSWNVIPTAPWGKEFNSSFRATHEQEQIRGITIRLSWNHRTGWWLNRPLLKNITSSKWVHLSQVRGGKFQNIFEERQPPRIESSNLNLHSIGGLYIRFPNMNDLIRHFTQKLQKWRSLEIPPAEWVEGNFLLKIRWIFQPAVLVFRECNWKVIVWCLAACFKPFPPPKLRQIWPHSCQWNSYTLQHYRARRL